MIINSTQNGCRIALLKDKSLLEFHNEENANNFNVGDVFLGTVKKVDPGLNAAFVDIGYDKDGFLHYHDLSPQVSSLNKFTKLSLSGHKGISPVLKNFKRENDIDKFGKINQVLTKNQQILVQIVKEPISTKGHRLSCELSLAGRFLVLVPFSDTVSVSKRISNTAERKRLQRLITSIKPENFGVIIRTVAEKKEVAELDKDLRQLVKKWENGMKKLKHAKPREKIVGEIGRVSSLLRDVLNESYDNIVVDDDAIHEEVKEYIREIAPAKEKIVKRYNGKAKIFEAYGIEKQLKTLFGKSVSLPHGGYLVIEHTEALHVVDVNSGNKSSDEADQESTAYKTNEEAAKEIARQLQLRDMGGIIVVDFIDMKKPDHKKLLYSKMKEFMQSDRSKFTVLPLSKFGLMQITRQRVRPELNIKTSEICPTCGGTGKIAPTILVSDQIERDLNYLLRKQNEKNISLAVHPYLHAYFTKGFISKQWKWYFSYFKWVNLVQDSSLALSEYNFTNKSGELIEI